MRRILIAVVLIVASVAPCSAGLLPAITHPIRHPKRDAKAVGHAAKETLKAAAKAIWYL